MPGEAPALPPAHPANCRCASSRQRCSCCCCCCPPALAPPPPPHLMPTSVSSGCCRFATTSEKKAPRRPTSLLQAERQAGRQGRGGSYGLDGGSACNACGQGGREQVSFACAVQCHKPLPKRTPQQLRALHTHPSRGHVWLVGASCCCRSDGTSTPLSSSPSAAATRRSGTRSAGTRIFSNAERRPHCQRHFRPRFSAWGRKPQGQRAEGARAGS
jgi:hypothetical protein